MVDKSKTGKQEKKTRDNTDFTDFFFLFIPKHQVNNRRENLKCAPV